jgi:hypothetical protein
MPRSRSFGEDGATVMSFVRTFAFPEDERESWALGMVVAIGRSLLPRLAAFSRAARFVVLPD